MSCMPRVGPIRQVTLQLRALFIMYLPKAPDLWREGNNGPLLSHYYDACDCNGCCQVQVWLTVRHVVMAVFALGHDSYIRVINPNELRNGGGGA